MVALVYQPPAHFHFGRAVMGSARLVSPKSTHQLRCSSTNHSILASMELLVCEVVTGKRSLHRHARG